MKDDQEKCCYVLYCWIFVVYLPNLTKYVISPAAAALYIFQGYN